MDSDPGVEPNGNETVERSTFNCGDKRTLPEQTGNQKDLRATLQSLLSTFELHQTTLLL